MLRTWLPVGIVVVVSAVSNSSLVAVPCLTQASPTGQEAYAQNDNEAIKSLGIFNSGFFSSDGSINAITKPTFYFMGGPSDIAYENVSFNPLCFHMAIPWLPPTR